VRRILAGLGLDEVLTHALIGPADLERVGLDPSQPGLVRVANPLAEQHSILRPTMAASMLASLAENVRQRRTDAWIFEVGKTYWMDAGKGPRWADSAGNRQVRGLAPGHRAARPRYPALAGNGVARR